MGHILRGHALVAFEVQVVEHLEPAPRHARARRVAGRVRVGVRHARAVVVAEALLESDEHGIVVGPADIHRNRHAGRERHEARIDRLQLRRRRAQQVAALAHVRRRGDDRRGAQRRVQLLRHEQVARERVDVVGAEREIARQLALVPGGDLVGVRHHAVGIVPGGAGVAHRLPRGELRRERRAHRIGDERATRQEGIGRERPVAWSRIEVVQRKVARERVREHRAGVDTADELEVRLVVEPAITTADDALAVHVVGEAHARLEVVLVDRIVVGAREQRVVDLVDRDDLEVVAHAEADRQVVIQLPLVLHECGEVRSTC